MVRNLLVLPSGEEIFSGVAGENAIKSVSLTRCVNAEQELSPGAVCAAMVEASVIAQGDIPLAAGDEITLYTVFDGGARTKQGVFVAEKPTWASANIYNLTAYDRVSLLDKDLTHWLTSLSGWPYRLLDFASMVCSECGLTLLTEEIPNGDYLVQAFSGEGITGRQIMQWAGQVAGRFCRATKDGEIEFAWYAKNPKVFGPEEKIAQTGPADSLILEHMAQDTQLQAVSMIPPSLDGVDSAKLWRGGKNLLDINNAGFYHQNGPTTPTCLITQTETGIRVDIDAEYTQLGRRVGVYLGTVEEFAGKTITANVDYAASMTDEDAHHNIYIAMTTVKPATSRDKPIYADGGYIGTSGTVVNLAQGSRVPATYTVTGEEEMPYIFLAFYPTVWGPASVGDWIEISNIQVEIGDTATSYEPYRGEIFTVDFDETVYGGSFDWNSGILTQTYGKIESYAGEAVSDGWLSSTGALSEGAQVIYPLAQNKTVQYTSKPISSLEGRNVLWSDCGNTAIVFQQEYYFENGLQFEDYQVAPVEKVQIHMTEDDVGAVYPDTKEACNTYILSGNYLLTNDDPTALEAVAQTLYKQLKDIAYTPCKMELPVAAGVEAGDILTVTDPNGRRFTTFVMSEKRTGQRETLECTGSPRRDCSTAVNEQTYKALSGKVLELRTDIEGLRAEHRDAQGNFANLELTVEGIATEVSQQQTKDENLTRQITSIQQTAEGISLAVQSIQNNGVSKVKTEMGYTFDDEGLKISRDGVEMMNLLDNTGMYVKRGDDMVLQANDEGVQAMNIAVRNYLMIGSHARFEDYNDGTDSRRTACFFCLGG